MNAQALIDRLTELRIREMDLRKETIEAIREVARTEAWRLTTAKSLRDFCSKDLGFSGEAVREILIEIGEILPVVRMIANNPASQARMTALLDWRNKKRVKMNVPAYRILSNRTIFEIAERNPQSLGELKDVSGVGEKKLEEFGEEVLRIVSHLSQRPATLFIS